MGVVKIKVDNDLPSGSRDLSSIWFINQANAFGPSVILAPGHTQQHRPRCSSTAKLCII